MQIDRVGVVIILFGIGKHMSGVFEDQGIEGLSEKLMDVVKEFKGDNSEVEVLKHIIIQSNLLLATANVRYFSVSFAHLQTALHDEQRLCFGGRCERGDERGAGGYEEARGGHFCREVRQLC